MHPVTRHIQMKDILRRAALVRFLKPIHFDFRWLGRKRILVRVPIHQFHGDVSNICLNHVSEPQPISPVRNKEQLTLRVFTAFEDIFCFNLLGRRGDTSC